MDFSPVGSPDAERAHQWHLGFAAANPSILPLTEAQFRSLVEGGYVWSASEQRSYVGLAYCTPSQEVTEWELRGLTVDAREAGRGVAGILARLALIDVLVKEDLLARGEKMIAHVQASNRAPRGLIEGALRFQLVRRDCYPSKDLPGQPVNADGMVEGDLFTMTNDTLRALVEWCVRPPTTLRDGRPIYFELRDGYSFEIFAAALRRMCL